MPKNNTPQTYRRKNNYQPNIITRSRQEFSLVERKLLVLFINHIDFELVPPNQNLTLKIPIADVDDNRERIEAACMSIVSKKIIIREEKSLTVLVPFPKVSYNEKEGQKKGSKGFIELTMFADVVPYFVDLRKQYTRYNLEIMLEMGSVFTQRLFEIVMMHKGRKQHDFRFHTDELRHILNCNYPNWADLKRRVLVPAQKEIAEKASILFTFEPCRKEGKKIVEVLFTLKTEKQLAIEAVNEEFNQYEAMDISTLIQNAAYLLTKYTFTSTQKDEILTNRELLIKFLEVESKLANGQHEAENHTAYIAKSLGWGGKKKNKNDKL